MIAERRRDLMTPGFQWPRLGKMAALVAISAVLWLGLAVCAVVVGKLWAGL